MDVGSCRGGTFELLKDPEDGEKLYCSAYTLDDNGKDMVVDHARSIGSCSTCDSGGSQKEGYRATIKGTSSGGGKSPTLKVTSVEDESIGCPGGATEPDSDQLDCSSGGGFIIAHATLMLIGWGVLLPGGVIAARSLRHRKDDLWFERHKWMQAFGIFVALIGLIIALARFNVFVPGLEGTTGFIHGVCGLVVMGLGLLQPINACFRPHAPEDGNQATKARRLWEILHKGSGYFALVLSVVTISLGISIVGSEYRLIFIIVYAIIATSMLFICVRAFYYHFKEADRPNYVGPTATNNTVNSFEMGNQKGIMAGNGTHL